MIEGHIIFNAILYSIVIAYILYINFSAYYQTGTGFLKALVNLFQNWIFRTVYLLIVGFFALDLFPYGGFVLAILLTIAFLNTNMLVYKKDVEESLTMREEEDEKNRLPMDVPIQDQTMMNNQNNQQENSPTPTYPSPESLGIQSNPSMIQPQPPQQPAQMNQQAPMMNQQQPMMNQQQPMMNQQAQMNQQQPMMNQQGTMTNQQLPTFSQQNPPSLPYQQPMMDQSQSQM
jgi:hypothetical protein